MRLFITLFIGLLLLGCKQPEADLEYWHVYAVPTSECHMYSDIPCDPETLPNTFKTEEEATEFARTQKNKRENVLWVKPANAPKPIVKPDPIIKKNIIYKEVYVKPDPTELNNLKDKLQEKENIIVDLEKELITINDCVTPEGKKVSHGGSVFLYKERESGYCQGGFRNCYNRKLNGDDDYKYETCKVKHTLSNGTVLEDSTLKPGFCEIYGSEDDDVRFDEPYIVPNDGYLCYEHGKKQYCRDGEMSTSLTGYSCRPKSTNKSSCKLDLMTIPHGMVEKAYKIKFSEPWNYCSDEDNFAWRLCNDGKLSGSSEFKYHNCNWSSTRIKEEKEEITPPSLPEPTINIGDREFPNKPRLAPVYASQRTKKLEYHDYDKCLDITKHDYFPMTKPYQDVISLAPSFNKIYSSYPISKCKEMCFDGYNRHYLKDDNENIVYTEDRAANKEACHKCEIEAYPSYCYAKRFFYVPHNSRFSIKIDEL